jgi:hypothetical protein
MTTDTAPIGSSAVDAAGASETGAAEADPRALTLANVERALDELRPYLMADGGNVEVVEIDRSDRQGAPPGRLRVLPQQHHDPEDGD